VEVLHGNQADSKHSRRRSDQFALAENRLLDWSLHDSDIKLLPHSPLALAGVLGQEGGHLDLVPKSEDLTALSGENENSERSNRRSTADDEQQEQAEPSSSREHHRGARRRFNLLTEHSNEDLLRQCKKSLVENALVKNKGDRQLYFAAGFISWPCTNKTDVRVRAPLLLYPALLVRIPDEQRYEVRLAGDSPEMNRSLAQHIDQRHACTLPEFDEDTQLVDYFAQVGASLKNASTVQLEYDVALGSTTLADNVTTGVQVTLPELPEHFDVSFAMMITGNKNLEQLTAILQLIPDFGARDDAKDDLNESTAEPKMDSAARLRRFAAKLAGEGLDHVEFKQLPSLPTSLARWTVLMTGASSTTTISDVLKIPDLSARQLIKLAGCIELIDKAPPAIEQWGHGDLCYASSTVLLRRAQHQAKLIEDELTSLREHFHLDKVPAKSQLLSLMHELSSDTEHEPDLVDAEYFNARRQFMEFSTKKPANLTADHRRALSQLTKVLRFRELFVNNVEYRAALGSCYKGLRTDWPTLIEASDYARELSEILASESTAAGIINNWQAFRASFASELETLQLSSEATVRLLATVGKRWQTQPISALAAHVDLISTRLKEWTADYGSVENHADKNAAAVLSSYSGPSMDQVLVETQVDETQRHIRQQLADGVIKIEQIEETLDWLLQASGTAADNALNIESIVAHLDIA